MNNGIDYYKIKLIFNKKEMKIKFLKNVKRWVNYAHLNPKLMKYQSYQQKIKMNRRNIFKNIIHF